MLSLLARDRNMELLKEDLNYELCRGIFDFELEGSFEPRRSFQWKHLLCGKARDSRYWTSGWNKLQGQLLDRLLKQPRYWSCAHALQALTTLAMPDTTPKGNALPSVVHATLTANQIGRGRVIVIGDIHGCSAELEDLLRECKYQQGLDIIVSVGDLVGKGPNSVQVLRRAQELGIITVRGNWDEYALANLRWLNDGSLSEEKWGWLRDLSAADIAYLEEMPFSLSIPSHHCIVTHAGMVPGIPLQQQQLYDLIEMRHVDLVDPPTSKSEASRVQSWKALPKRPRDAGKPWATVWPGPEHVVFGHHARRRLQACSYASGIDTGCCLGDQLTALVLPEIQFLPGWGRSLESGGFTREALGARLVSIQARQQYLAPDED